MQKRVVEPQADETRSETDKVAVETRLTAEQFEAMLLDDKGYTPSPEAVAAARFWMNSELRGDVTYPRPLARIIDSVAEAFRDKSEAGLRDETCAHSMFHKGCYACAMRDREAFGKNAKGLREEIADMQSTFDLMWEADMRAIKMWQAANPGNDHVWPDRSKLTLWLIRRAEAAEAEAAALRERCETFVEHTCTGSALCKECGKALVGSPGAREGGEIVMLSVLVWLAMQGQVQKPSQFDKGSLDFTRMLPVEQVEHVVEIKTVRGCNKGGEVCMVIRELWIDGVKFGVIKGLE